MLIQTTTHILGIAAIDVVVAVAMVMAAIAVVIIPMCNVKFVTNLDILPPTTIIDMIRTINLKYLPTFKGFSLLRTLAIGIQYHKIMELISLIFSLLSTHGEWWQSKGNFLCNFSNISLNTKHKTAQ